MQRDHLVLDVRPGAHLGSRPEKDAHLAIAHALEQALLLLVGVVVVDELDFAFGDAHFAQGGAQIVVDRKTGVRRGHCRLDVFLGGQPVIDRIHSALGRLRVVQDRISIRQDTRPLLRVETGLFEQDFGRTLAALFAKDTLHRRLDDLLRRGIGVLGRG